MALTPEDVVNKRFQPTKFREGYDQDEVDDFLDEIVVELRRLNQENEELRRTAAGGSADANGAVPAPVSAGAQTAGVSSAGADGGPTTTTGVDSVAVQPVSEAPASEVAAPTTADQDTADSGTTSASATAGTSDRTTDTAESAAGVLAMAQRLHDEYVNAGVEQRDKIIAEAQREATTLVDSAEETSRRTLGALEEDKSVLERKVEQLRGFERDYRSRLKDYIEGQLRDLDVTGSVVSNTSAS
ncbi:DivIVA domain-containing protein [Arthrobacter echini]|uniref:Cell wall synthesis protein Wag31 n=1 Tax=Arthrobacter echini TaxID=1529066 RepID=A0A4S5E7F0_9MICC|nr:DivIVA domain-containing protein [Arthrobacter echini]THJ67537.1 DivIVA domain-containing protein [Arthrobacter echini]